MDKAEDYVRVSPRTLAVAQIVACAATLTANRQGPDRLLDAVRSAHLALQASLIAALAGTAGVGAFDEKLAGKHLDWLSTKPIDPNAEPKQRVMELSALLQTAQTNGLVCHFGGPAMALTASEQDLLARLIAIRDAIEHPKPGSHSFEIRYLVEPIPVAVRQTLWVLAHPAIAHQMTPDDQARAHSAADAIDEFCGQLLA